jgi:pimeloyl-ACP methyl ester carboxylesterase
MIPGVRLAYEEWGEGAPLLAVHGHFGRGAVWAPLAKALPGWRIVAPDQRGHGRTGPGPDYSREGYVGDAADLLEALGLAPAVVLGHSLGGVNAYQLAARRPELVRAVIVEDAPAELPVRPDIAGADPDINTSRRLLAGDHWADWLAGEYPVLLLRGMESDTLAAAMAREMAARRPNTRLVEFPGAGHAIHDDDPEGFALAVASFLAEL